MFAWISGTVKNTLEDRLVIETGGIGYELYLPQKYIPEQVLESQAEFHLYTHVREDQITLFAFPELLEKELFLLLMKVSGIGAKTALGIVSNFSPQNLIAAISHRDVASLQAVKGIGKKAAEKITLELHDKMSAFELNASTQATRQNATPNSGRHDLISALINLGYKKPQVDRALETLEISEDSAFDQSLRQALQVLGSAS
ncbi:MAG: Holliday junction branch migration protein RuvA [Bdellovibrionales bacterium]|nr:Holliday junction branch migration protein RuvA [Bdellovibrionales bacterium]